MNRRGGYTNGDRRQHLERRAAAVRAALEQRLDVLDARRQRVTHVVRTATRPPVAGLLLGVVGVGLVLLLARRQRPRRFALINAPAESRGFWRRAFERVAMSIVTAIVHGIAARGVDRTLHLPALPERTTLR